MFRHWRDLNQLVQIALEEPSDDLLGKKYLAHGKESLSFTEIDNLIKQVYFKGQDYQSPQNVIRRLNEGFQMFYHGNTHVMNFGMMLDYLQGKESRNEGFENLSSKVNLQLIGLREFYSQQAERSSNEEGQTEEEDNLTYPDFQSYWNVSLN